MKAALISAIAVAFTALVPIAAQAQASPIDLTSTVVVIGRGQLVRDPEYQDLEVRLRGEGATQVSALAALKSQQDRVSQGLAGMTGANRVRVISDDFTVVQSFPSDCEDDYGDSDRANEGKCAPTGFIARMNLSVRLYPASLGGAAASLAAELGATRVEIGGTGVDDPTTLKADAARLAFEDARAQADLAARAAGVRLGRVVRIQDSDASLLNELPSTEVEGVVVTGSRLPRSPTVAISVTPDKVTTNSSLTVVFALDR